MSSAASLQPDPLSALMRRLAVLLMGLLGSLLAELLAERDALPVGDGRRKRVMGKIAVVRRVLAQMEAQAKSGVHEEVEYVLVPAPWRLLYSVRLGCRVVKGGRGGDARGRAMHPRLLHPPDWVACWLWSIGNRPQGGAVVRP